jgi:hypothetical protein
MKVAISSPEWFEERRVYANWIIVYSELIWITTDYQI